MALGLEFTLQESKKKIYNKAIFMFELARSAVYTYESLTLPLLEYLATGHSKLNKEQLTHIKNAYAGLLKLLKQDSANIAQGLYPIEVLKTESLSQHLTRIPQIWLDGLSIARRRREKKHHEFSREELQWMRDLPEYYQRNFHFQTGGYLSEKSAELYEHQVEILFAGAADAMRRLIIPQLKAHFPYTEGEGLKFLELGAGTGRLTRFVALAFPKAQIIAMDLSSPYLKKARETNLANMSRVDFIQGDAAEIPFTDEKFDAVFSCFMFHELPLDIRKKIMRESARVTKQGGFIGFVDSLQNDDMKELNWALEQFPQDFHEPFFKNYVMNSMEGILMHTGLEKIQKDIGFLSKAVSAKKPFTS